MQNPSKVEILKELWSILKYRSELEAFREELKEELMGTQNAECPLCPICEPPILEKLQFFDKKQNVQEEIEKKTDGNDQEYQSKEDLAIQYLVTDFFSYETASNVHVNRFPYRPPKVKARVHKHFKKI